MFSSISIGDFLALSSLEQIVAKMRVGIIGQGYIGLPLALLIASTGIEVHGYDINKKLIVNLLEGKPPFEEEGIGNLLKSLLGKTYFPTSDLDSLDRLDVVIIAVPTPLSESSPNLMFLRSALESAAKVVRRGGTIIVESTLPPGSKNKIVGWLRELGMEEGRDYYIAYCPERAMPGRLLEELIWNTRIIGADDEEAARASEEIYKRFVKGEIIRTSFSVAEVVKLVENTYRDVNIALANEVARACEVLGVDYWEVMRLANKHPRVNLLRAGVGVGGSCLTKDPLFLYLASKDRGYEPDLILYARRVNMDGPVRYARQVHRLLFQTKNGYGSRKIAVLGVTYKGNVNDTRESPARDFIKFFLRHGYMVSVFDPHTGETFGGMRAEDPYEAASGADCVAVLADHWEFKELILDKLAALMTDPPVLFDGRGMFSREDVENSGIIYVGVGLPHLIKETVVDAPLSFYPLNKKAI